MIKSKGFTIWIEPTGKLLENFTKIIKNLSEEFKTPAFTPHATILGTIEQPLDQVLKKAAKLASMLKSFEIELTGEIVCKENDWTRTMVVLSKQTPELMESYQTASRIFKIHQPSFIPHMSLMYSEDTPIQKRRDYAKGLNPKKLSGKFQVNYLTLMGNDGKVEDWRKVQKFALMS